MPVRKFRGVEEMPDELWRPIGTPELALAIERVWSFAQRTTAPRFPPGIHKHRSLEAAQEQRERWAERNFRAYWDRQRDRARPRP
jgi:hypothetical protein